MKNYILDEELGMMIIQYLASRPYSEVINLIQRMQSLKSIVIDSEESDANISVKME